jgi:hypothetical protein
VSYQGDFVVGSTVVVRFNTQDPTGAPVTLAGTPAVSVYKNSTTQSTTGVTLSVDYDGVTGFHSVAIDTSADGTFYAAGNTFDVVITTGTVNGVSAVGDVVGTFSLENRSALMPTTTGRKLDVSAGGEAGLDWNNIGSPSTTQTLSGTTVKSASDVETDTQDIQSRLPAALVSGRIDASVGAMASDVVTASAIAADAIGSSELAASAVSEIQSGLSTLDAAGVRSAVGLASANLDAQISILSGLVSNIAVLLDGLQASNASLGSTGNDTTHVHLSALTFGDDEINNQLLVIYDASEDEYHARWVEDWVNSSKLATVATLPFTPAGGTDGFSLFSIRRDVDTTKWSGTAVATPDTAGYPKVTLKNGTGTGEVNLSSGVADANVTKFGGTAGTFASGIPEVKTASIAAGAVTASAIATDAIDSDALAASAVSEIQSGLSTLDAAGVRSAIGLASANLDTQLAAIHDFLDTEIAAIKAKTDNLPSDPADASDIASAFSTLTALFSSSTTEPTSIAAQTASILAKINTLYQLATCKFTQTVSGTATLYKADSTTTVGTSTNSDDGSIFTRGKIS